MTLLTIRLEIIRFPRDLFQFNLLAGYKASKYWYYSTNVSFKTQFLHNYKANTRDLKGAFLSPGELNVGVGMTYNYANPKRHSHSMLRFHRSHGI